MSFDLVLLLMDLLVGFITQQMFKILVIDPLTPKQLACLKKTLVEKADYQTLAFIEIRCNKNPEDFLLTFMRVLMFLAGFLAPIGFYFLNKEISTIGKD